MYIYIYMRIIHVQSTCTCASYMYNVHVHHTCAFMYILLSCDNWGNPVIQCKLCTCVYVVIFRCIKLHIHNYNIHVYMHIIQYMYMCIYTTKYLAGKRKTAQCTCTYNWTWHTLWTLLWLYHHEITTVCKTI